MSYTVESDNCESYEILVDGKVVFESKEVKAVEIIIRKPKRLAVKSCSVTVQGNMEGPLSVKTGDCTIEGDATCAVDVQLGDIKIKGSVNGNINAHMGDVNIDGAVTGNVSAKSGNVSVLSETAKPKRQRRENF